MILSYSTSKPTNGIAIRLWNFPFILKIHHPPLSVHGIIRSVMAPAFIGILTILESPLLVTWMPSSSACPPEEENTPVGSDSWSLCCILLKACTIWGCVTGGEKQWFKKRGKKRQFLGLMILVKKPWNIMTLRLQNAGGKNSRTQKKPQTSPDLNQSHYLRQSVTHACWVLQISGSEVF